MNIVIPSILLFATVQYTFQKRPNILLIIVDDLRPALGAYNDPNSYTPNIDKLAENSFVFTNTFAQQALCAPSRNSFLTSRRPDSLHLYDFYSYWRHTVGNFTTIPQHFRDHGYITHSIGKVFHEGESSNHDDDAPYSWSLPPFHPKTNQFKDAPVCLVRTGERKANLMCPVLLADQPMGTLPDIETMQKAKEFLLEYRKRSEESNSTETKKNSRRRGEDTGDEDEEGQESDKKPYFLAVGFHKPHVPIKFPREYLKFHPLAEVRIPPNHYRPAALPSVAWAHWADVRVRDDIAALNVSFPYGLLPERTVREVTQHYNAAVSYIDEMVGEVLRAASEEDGDVAENTIVALIGDHGWSWGEHGEFAKYSNFDVATRVPLIIHVPGLNRGNTIYVNELAELVDLFPTLVDLTQVSEELKVCPAIQNKVDSILCTEGQSLLPVMASNVAFAIKRNNLEIITEKKTAVFSQYPRASTFPTLKPNNDKPRLKNINIMGYSIRTVNYRYTEWVKFDNNKFVTNWKKVYATELYDHTIDPDENMNLADRNEMDSIISKLRKQLRLGWRYAEDKKCEK